MVTWYNGNPLKININGIKKLVVDYVLSIAVSLIKLKHLFSSLSLGERCASQLKQKENLPVMVENGF